MNEVSCQVLDVFFQRARQERRPFEELTRGVPYSLEHLQRRDARIDWSAFVQFMHNAGIAWSAAELSKIGESFFLSRGMRAMSLIARLLFDASGFYRWVFEKQTGAGDQSFRGVFQHQFQQLGPGLVQLELRLEDGFAPCPEFYPVALGNFRGMPRALGLPPARVKMTLHPWGARYEVAVPDGAGLLRRARQKALLPFTAAAAGRELKDSLLALQGRYLELSEARSALAEKSARLEIVNRLGREMARHTAVEDLAAALERLFQEALPDLAYQVHMATEDGNGWTLLCGSRKPLDELVQTLPLSSGTERVGRIDVFSSGTTEAQRALVEDLAPFVGIALNNARSFTLLQGFRNELSRKVEARTHELNEAMKQLADSLEQQREAIRLKTEFFDNVSHELRTPLTLILLTIESLRLEPPGALPPVVAQHIDGLHRSAARLLRLINDLLDLAKLGAGRMRIHYDAIEMHEFLSTLLIPFRVMADRSGVTLDLVGERGATVFADAEKLEVVFQNLVSNALKFTARGEVRVRIERSSDYVVVSVEDTGAGIPASDLSHIFNRFSQADEQGTRRFGGTGIGLALVKELVELHEGTVEVESAAGKGSTFRISLPRGTAHIREDLRVVEAKPGRGRSDAAGSVRQIAALGSTNAHATSEQTPSKPSLAPEHVPHSTDGRPRVLVVEDDEEIRRFLTAILSPLYEVLEAANGREGLQRAQAEHPRIVVSDVMMPVMSGLQLLSALREDPKTADLPVVLLTARHDVDARVGGLNEGANDYLGKPFAPRELIARIETQLRLQDASARAAKAERLAAMSLLTSGFAHEVRNPLNGLMNAIEPLRESLRDPSRGEDAEPMVSIIQESATRILFLAESLLMMARESPERSPIALAESIRGAERALAWRLTPRTQLVLQLDEEAQVPGDSRALEQVWTNLFDNALRAVGVEGTITVRAVRTGSEIVVTVTDTGPGVAPELLPRLFDPFFSTRPAGEGTGLGLVLCKRIVEQHGGRISISSEVGAGATVTVRLPAVVGQAQHSTHDMA